MGGAESKGGCSVRREPVEASLSRPHERRACSEVEDKKWVCPLIEGCWVGWMCVSRCPTFFPSVGLDVEARHQLDTCSESGGRQAKVGGPGGSNNT